MNVKQKENATLRNILKNLKELKQRGDLSKIKAKREEYLRLLKNEQPSSLRKLNTIVNKLTKESSTPQSSTPTREELTAQHCVSESQCEENRKAQEIQHDHVDIDSDSYVRRMSNDASTATTETANLLKRNDFDVFDLFRLIDFQS